MGNPMKRAVRMVAAGLALVPLAAAGQDPLAGMRSGGQTSRASEAQAAVEFLYPEQVTLEAGRPRQVTLHFRVAEGMHINSHITADADLIPAVFSVPSNAGVRLEEARYPPGVAFTLPADPKTKLDVYTGEFTIDAVLVTAKGDHLVEARLRYQACDNAACMPPKTLVVAMDVKGR
jgi:hypothetical protein